MSASPRSEMDKETTAVSTTQPLEEPAAPSPWSTSRLLLGGLIAGLSVFAIGLVVDWLLLYRNEARITVIEVSDALAGLIAGVLVFRLLQYERERRRRLRQRLEVIAEMNHHIRNALQVISLSAASTSDQRMLDDIRGSVNRIQWALREILPKL